MDKQNNRNVVCVFGSSDPREGDNEYQLAFETGQVLAELGFHVANGGYAGTMEASARGAKQAGGQTVGVTCSIWKSQPNQWIDLVIRTEGLTERLERLVELGRGGYVVLPGATGTLLELAMVWELMCKRMMESRPIICVGEFYKPLVDMMCQQRPDCEKYVVLAQTPQDLRKYLTPPTK